MRCEFDNSSTPGRMYDFYQQLLGTFGHQKWWPGDTPWEIALGAVLTQNTSWTNVEKAICSLKSENAISVQTIATLPDEELARLIRPSGYHNLKTKRVKNLAHWWLNNFERVSNSKVAMEEIRTSLLMVKGIGEETADSILVYALGRKSFVVDAYTRRFLERHKIIESSLSYKGIQELIEMNLPSDVCVYNEFHALIVHLGKTYCRPKPQCEQCPLQYDLSSESLKCTP